MYLNFEQQVQAILRAFFEQAIKDIQKNIKTKPVYNGKPANASGKTAESLYYVIEGFQGILCGADHIFAVEFGRKPTSGGGAGISLKDRIRIWIDDKGIVPKGKISKDSLAFVFARNIHEKGTIRYQIGQPSGVLSEVINVQRIEDLTKELLPVLIQTVVSKLIETFEK